MPREPDRPEQRPSALKAWVRALERTEPIARAPRVTLPLVIEDLADRLGDAPALICGQECLSYTALARRARQYARWALRQGVGPGDVVGLMLANGVDYLPIWLGIVQVGGVVALLNTNLTGNSLAHCIRLAAPRHLVVGSGFVQAFVDCATGAPGQAAAWVHGADDPRLPRLEAALPADDRGRLTSAECAAPSIADPALYIYTSGTTGLPKVAIVSHFRVMQWTHWFAGILDIQPTDRMYNCLPMYHSVGGVVATGATLVGGGSVVLRERFSATTFWADVAAWDCTLFQYIGEICRYLADSPPHPQEASHRLRLACGNGLRPDVWQRFQRRFAIPAIVEFYAATEATFSLYNCEGKPGAVGRIPPFLAHRFPVLLIQVDPETNEPQRGEGGLCQPCRTGEIGEAVGKVSHAVPFEGYTDAAATDRKLLRDVAVPGDLWFRTGDLMRKDAEGFFYFVDRAGDTFRWKGENVSTSEVAEAILACPGVIEAVVYGVAVPGSDGRAGMAAIVVRPGFALDGLRAHLAAHLPGYAQPVFLRLRGMIETTATHKPRKQDLITDGFDPSGIDDPLYLNERASQRLLPLDAALFGRIVAGSVRL